MFEEFRRLYCFIDSLGLNLKKILCLRSLPRYFSDRARFKKAGGRITADFPILSDFSDTAGTASGHYFHQDLLVAEQIFRANPERHLDVGSRIDGFVAHVASFRQIEVLDIRPLPDCGHPNIHFRQCDLMQLDASLVGACESISCLHALEHFGLGRYGDKIDPDGHRKGFENLVRMLKPGGTLYLSFPIREPSVQFNAHRVFAPSDVLAWAEGSPMGKER